VFDGKAIAKLNYPKRPAAPAPLAEHSNFVKKRSADG
jgi:hypothetical protein